MGITLLFLLTVASIIGTCFPLEKALQLIYYTWWFQALLLATMVSMGCATWRTIAEKTLPSLRVHFLKSPAIYADFAASLETRFEGSAPDVAYALTKRGFKATIENDCGYACKGLLSRWGAPVAHVGIIIVLLGGFASRWMSSEGVVILMEGEETKAMIPSEALPALRAGSMKNPPMIPLGFTLSCEDFETGYFPKTTIPSKYISTVTALDADPPVRAERVEVNHSVTINGWTLHQTSCQEVPGEQRFLVEIREPDAEKSAPIAMEISPGQTRLLPGARNCGLRLDSQYPYAWHITENIGFLARPLGSGALYGADKGLPMLCIERFEPDFVRSEGRQIKSRSRELNNPAVLIVLHQPARPPQRQWLFAREELKQAMRRPLGDYECDLTAISGHDPDWLFHITAWRTNADAGDEPPVLPPLAPRLRSANAASTAPIELALALGDEAPLTDSQASAKAAPLDDSGASSSAGGTGESGEDHANQWRVRRVKNVVAYVTTLTLTRNRALWLIYAGCGAMMAGLLIAFLPRRKEIWFQVNAAEKKLRVAGKYRYPSQTLDAATLQALEKLNIRGDS
ncbi:MAG: cytochrome c biogenesis protein ResB [Candidatus Sumerlaeota bacterium]|nr:cytochrome c biogenesis protein ResB [Candidatus Sumerlaeota bacterium]